MNGNEEYEDMSASEKDSEFDSEEEDAEFRLYQQLYFEPNTDEIKDDAQKSSPTQGRQNVKNVGEPLSKQIVGLDGRHPRGMQDSKHLSQRVNKVSHPTHAASEISKNKNSHLIDYIYIDTLESSPVCLKNTITQQAHANTAYDTLHDDGAPIHVTREGVSVESGRKRVSSICSDGSISGNMPLDVLYCNLVTSDEEGEEEEEREIMNRMKMKDIETNSEKRAKDLRAIAKSNKRKRTFSSDDELEDSRCSALINAASKNAAGGKADTEQVEEDGDADNDLYVIASPTKTHPEILTLDTDSDHEDGTSTLEALRKNKYQKIGKSQSSAPIGNKKKGKLKGAQHRSEIVGKQHRERQGGSLTIGSESDSNDIDLPEATRGTDLILNIDKTLTSWVRTITKGADATLRIKVTKEAPKSTHSCIDFTLGRPNTTTIPSVDKWTQNMTNFYDSDVSDDFDVSAIQQQQSDIRGDWHRIAGDYQGKRIRRYYNVVDRCKTCKQEGHTAKDCSRVPVCHLCSSTGHTCRRDCPDNCCFKCGGKPHFFCNTTSHEARCSLCGYFGHSKELCPDLWRRFHLTTRGLTPQTPLQPTTRPSKERYCCVCCKRGHYGYECSFRPHKQVYLQSPQSVVDYSCPVILDEDGYFMVNLNGRQSVLQDNGNMTLIPISTRDVGKIIGKNGSMIKSIKSETGAVLSVINSRQPEVQVFGPPEVRLKAQEIIEIITRKREGEYICESQKTNLKTKEFSSSNSNTQDSWCEKYLSQLKRHKTSILNKISQVFKFFNPKRYEDLGSSIRELELFREKKKSEPSFQPSQNVDFHLRRIARKVLGSGRYGNGNTIFEDIVAMQQWVQEYPYHFIPKDMCRQIVEVMQPLYHPSIDELDQLLQYAQQYKEQHDPDMNDQCTKEPKKISLLNVEKKKKKPRYKAKKKKYVKCVDVTPNGNENNEFPKEINAKIKKKMHKLRLSKKKKTAKVKNQSGNDAGTKKKKMVKTNKKKTRQAQLCRKNEDNINYCTKD